MNIFIIVLALGIIITTLTFILTIENGKYGAVKWTSSDSTCSIDATVRKMLDDSGIIKTTNDDWDVYIPCSYNELKKQIDTVPTDKSSNNDKPRKIFMIDNADELCSKSNVWSNIVRTYGREMAKNIMPTTYVLTDNKEMNLFEKEYNRQHLYILKKNIQRQKGLLITDDKNVIMNGRDNGYVVVQELLQNPYLIEGRKINLRVYILIVCDKGTITTFLYNDGFVYYTAEKFKKKSLETAPNITTGYIDRKVYKDNPLTHMDLRHYLDSKNRELTQEEMYILSKKQKISEYVFSSIYEMLHNVVKGMDGIICKRDSRLYNNTTFQLLGADVAINEDLEPQLIEINKGPDLGAKDERDAKLKHSVVKDMLKVLRLFPNDNSKQNDIGGFIKIM